ncbi:hypothetical protein E2C01_019675 [Portunus trituberculatus]|uniref:Uncharacterized protein n=1 Tax=Portunus trituberculatus TaxID=210409 RepID=A0A5B7DXW2_PORTR|nr:hypothetical protein [Portunus trituberculatus]
MAVHTCHYATEIAGRKKYRLNSSSRNTFTHNDWKVSSGWWKVSVNKRLPNKMSSSGDDDDCDQITSSQIFNPHLQQQHSAQRSSHRRVAAASWNADLRKLFLAVEFTFRVPYVLFYPHQLQNLLHYTNTTFSNLSLLRHNINKVGNRLNKNTMLVLFSDWFLQSLGTVIKLKRYRLAISVSYDSLPTKGGLTRANLRMKLQVFSDWKNQSQNKTNMLLVLFNRFATLFTL